MTQAGKILPWNLHYPEALVLPALSAPLTCPGAIFLQVFIGSIPYYLVETFLMGEKNLYQLNFAYF